MEKLTTSQVAERLGVGQSTVNLWCRQGRFPQAERVETPQGGYWLVPESNLVGFELPKMGRPSKKQEARRAIRLLLEKIEAEAFGITSKEVPLLDEVISLCEANGLTHHDCVVARERRAAIGDEAATKGRQNKTGKKGRKK